MRRHRIPYDSTAADDEANGFSETRGSVKLPPNKRKSVRSARGAVREKSDVIYLLIQAGKGFRSGVRDQGAVVNHWQGGTRSIEPRSSSRRRCTDFAADRDGFISFF